MFMLRQNESAPVEFDTTRCLDIFQYDQPPELLVQILQRIKIEIMSSYSARTYYKTNLI